nr:hypothetical protein BaRGS_002114 [Batillaria attramentaria]
MMMMMMMMMVNGQFKIEFTTDLVIEQRWTDDRLKFYDLVDASFLELDTRMMTHVWVPDLYISNEKHAAFHDVTVPNRLMHLHHDGSITYKARLSVTATCYMDLQDYPIDRQLCSLFIQSFAFSTRNLVFRWALDNAIRTNPKTPLPHFNLIRSEVDACDGNTTEGNFTCLQVDFHLERYLGFYLLHMYMPTSLVVAVSWLSFWLHPHHVAARTSLGILTVLTITTQATAAASSLPKVSYVKAIDIWMAACLFFVFDLDCEPTSIFTWKDGSEEKE